LEAAPVDMAAGIDNWVAGIAAAIPYRLAVGTVLDFADTVADMTADHCFAPPAHYVLASVHTSDAVAHYSVAARSLGCYYQGRLNLPSESPLLYFYFIKLLN
jgi:hypothetical protein